jgi:hypothetical protein
MKALKRRHVSTVPRAVATLVAVLAMALGGTVSPPAASAKITHPPCSWSALGLLNGWQPDQSTYYGDPSFCIDNGIVYLSGALVQTGCCGPNFADLPQLAWPQSKLLLSVYTTDGTTGVLTIYPDGEMEATGSDAAQFTSLAGISFPSAWLAPPGQPLPLTPAWQSAAQDGTGDPSYFTSGGIVHLSGSVGTNTADPWWGGEFQSLLPADARPTGCTEVSTYTSDYTGNGVPGWLDIDPGDTQNAPEMQVFAQDDRLIPTPLAFASLAGISYPAAGANWTGLSLLHNWTWEEDGDCWTAEAAPSYYVSGGIVYLAGALTHGASTPGPFAVLPAGARPSHTLYLTVNGLGQGDQPYLEIDPQGNMFLSPVSGPALVTGSLDGISFQATS